jgi:hypothetical protein
MMTPPKFRNQPRDQTRINFLSKKSLPQEESQRNSIFQCQQLLKTRKQLMSLLRNMREKSIRLRAY